MVKLSPKALRFAEAATRDMSGRNLLDAKRQAVWHEWSGARENGAGPVSSRYFEVPDQVGSLFLLAIETLISEMTRNRDDPDGEAGNDLEFLHSIHAALIHRTVETQHA